MEQLHQKSLDLRDISIIDALPVYDWGKNILTVGAGHGRLEWHLAQLGYDVTASDIVKQVTWDEKSNLKFMRADILDFPGILSDVVICSQVLEHIKEYKLAFSELITCARVRIIVTVPDKFSFHSNDHVNHWDEKNIQTFKKMASPFSTAISKIRTKKEDIPQKWLFLITVDKRQHYG